MLTIKEEKRECDGMVTVVLATLPKICRGAIEAREPSKVASTRKARLQDAIHETELLLAFLRDVQFKLGWRDDRSSAA